MYSIRASSLVEVGFRKDEVSYICFFIRWSYDSKLRLHFSNVNWFRDWIFSFSLGKEL